MNTHRLSCNHSLSAIDICKVAAVAEAIIGSIVIVHTKRCGRFPN